MSWSELEEYDRAVQRAASAVRAYTSGPGYDRDAVLLLLDAALLAGLDILGPAPDADDVRDYLR